MNMPPIDYDALSPVSWITANQFVNESQKPMEFTRHRFLLEPFEDMHPDIVVKKSAQIGFSVLSILKSFWLAKYGDMTTIYVLPTQDIVKSFVQPKIDPLIVSNPKLAQMITKDSITLKQVGDRFIHYKGSSSQREAISTTADLLVIDEYDRCLDMNVLNTYDSRLQASEYGWRWRFSNPSQVGFGVDALFNDSDQRHWMVTHSCGYTWYMDFESDGKCHYVDKKRKIYACGECDGEVTNLERQNGQWIARYPGHKRHGYWFSQMMAPWVSAERILEQEEESSIDFFYNFVLGKAYTPSDMIVNRETILRANAPSTIQKQVVAMGVDQDAGGCYYELMTPQGVFGHGYVKSWEEIEHIKLMYQATVVCDPNPYSTMPKQMAEKYSDWYMCYFKDMKGLNTVEWKGSVVYADRTRVIDIVANEIVHAKLLFRERPYELEDVISHWENLYRTTVVKEDGHSKSTWIKKEGRQSDYPFALTYARIALSRMLGGSADIVEPSYTPEVPITNVVNKDGTITSDFSQIMRDTWDEME